jgi:membrane associated rhomboid family serine protease
MVFPLYDDNSDRRTTPFVNWVFIAINIVVFVFFQGLGGNDRFTYAFSTVPQEITTGKDLVTPDRKVVEPSSGQTYILPGLQPTPIPLYLTLLTAMFMHGGIMHIVGNMLYLFIFGDNIEDRLGHLRYAVFYLLTGLIASLSHVFTNLGSEIPSLGASGAISGVLGGYLLLFPHKRVTVLLFRMLTDVPAYVALGLWIVMQIAQSYLSGGRDGVAYAAHIGGFIAGLLLIKIFAIGRNTPPPIDYDPRFREYGR